jgi:hypothetical protein
MEIDTNSEGASWASFDTLSLLQLAACLISTPPGRQFDEPYIGASDPLCQGRLVRHFC